MMEVSRHRRVETVAAYVRRGNLAIVRPHTSGVRTARLRVRVLAGDGTEHLRRIHARERRRIIWPDRQRDHAEADGGDGGLDIASFSGRHCCLVSRTAAASIMTASASVITARSNPALEDTASTS